jgi:hypothetical protein
MSRKKYDKSPNIQRTSSSTSHLTGGLGKRSKG